MTRSGDAPAGPDSIIGVRSLDHTADVGLVVRAPALAELFHRAALGAMALVRGDLDEPDRARRGPAVTGASAAPVTHTELLELDATDAAALLADWLRELLYAREVRQLEYVGSRPELAEPRRLRARVRYAAAGGAAREIKGVTYHGLEVEPTADGWRARVVFDV